MFCYELKHQFGILFFLCAAAAAAIMFTQFIPKDWRMLAAPMRFSNFIYTQLEQDVSRGESGSVWIDYEECPRVIYSQEVLVTMEEMMNAMNPGGISDRETILTMEFAVSEEELKEMLRELGVLIGTENYYSGAEYLYGRYQGAVYPNRAAQDPGRRMIQFRDRIRSCLFWGEYQMSGEYFGRTIRITEEERAILQAALEEVIEIMNHPGGLDAKYFYFTQRMRKLDQDLGGGTPFAPEDYSYAETVSYEQALSYYESEIEAEGLEWVYARYCSDYMGIVFGILPAIPAIFAMIRERRAGTREVIYPRNVSSGAMIGAKLLGIWVPYAGLLLALMLGTAGYLCWLMRDPSFLLSFAVYAVCWLMPSLLISTALPGLMALLMENEMLPAACWFVVCFYSLAPLIGDYPIWKPVLRFNEIGGRAVFAEHFFRIAVNRVGMVLGSAVCAAVMVWVLEQKRKGWNGRKLRIIKFNVKI